MNVGNMAGGRENIAGREIKNRAIKIGNGNTHRGGGKNILGFNVLDGEDEYWQYRRDIG